MKFFLLQIVFALFIFSNLSAIDLIGTIEGENDGDQYGSSVCVIDFNNDGFKDLAVGASATDDVGLSSGRVYLYYGGPSADTIADLIFIGVTSSFFGQSVASAGDFNNDGAEDLIVGAPFYDVPASSAGAVLLFYGGSTPDTSLDNLFTGEAGGDKFGTSVAGIGDFNNDGFDDFAVGAFHADYGSFTRAGKVYIYYGGTNPDFAVDRILVGEADGERFGYSITGGDFSGDGISDIAVGAYSYDDSAINQGRIYWFNGGTNPDTLFDLTAEGVTDNDKFGWSLASGKINNDAFVDLIMGSDGFRVDTFSTGKIYIFNGGAGIDGNHDQSYSLNRTENDYLGFSVASGADLNGDGMDEILTGMPGNDDGVSDGGGILLINGGNIITVDTTILGAISTEELGHSVVFWEDYGSSGSMAFSGTSQAFNNFRGRLMLYTVDISNNNCCVDQTGNVDNDPQDNIDIGDITALIDYLFISGIQPICLDEANTDGIGGVDIGDLTALIDFLFISATPPAPCQ